MNIFGRNNWVFLFLSHIILSFSYFFCLRKLLFILLCKTFGIRGFHLGVSPGFISNSVAAVFGIGITFYFYLFFCNLQFTYCFFFVFLQLFLVASRDRLV